MFCVRLLLTSYAFLFSFLYMGIRHPYLEIRNRQMTLRSPCSLFVQFNRLAPFELHGID